MKFKVEQYETHTTTLMVEAKSLAEAIHRVYCGEGECMDGRDYVGIDEDLGMSTEDLSDEDIEELGELDCLDNHNHIISIRSVERVHE